MTIDNDSSTPLLQVRLIIGDSSSDLMSDATINALLTINDNNVHKTAIQALTAIVADLAKQVRHKVDGVEMWADELYRQYKDLLDKLLKDPAYMLAPALHVLGGVSKKEAARVNGISDSRRIGIKDKEYSNSNLFEYDPYNTYFLNEE